MPIIACLKNPGASMKTYQTIFVTSFLIMSACRVSDFSGGKRTTVSGVSTSNPTSADAGAMSQSSTGSEVGTGSDASSNTDAGTESNVNSATDTITGTVSTATTSATQAVVGLLGTVSNSQTNTSSGTATVTVTQTQTQTQAACTTSSAASFAGMPSGGDILAAQANQSGWWNIFMSYGRFVGSSANISNLVQSGLNPWWSHWSSGYVPVQANDTWRKERMIAFVLAQGISGNSSLAVYNVDTKMVGVKAVADGRFIPVISIYDLINAVPGVYAINPQTPFGYATSAFNNAVNNMLNSNPNWCR